MLFAMNRGSHSDKARLQVLEQRRGVRTITVSEKAETVPGEHFEVDFKARGWPRVLKWIGKLTKDCGVPVFAFLDYFWVECRYFERRYGLDWYSSKAPSLLSVGVSKVFLPHSPEIASSLQSVPSAVRTTFARYTPLSVATKKAVLPRDRGNNETHISKLLVPPFVVFDLAVGSTVKAFSYLIHFTQSFTCCKLVCSTFLVTSQLVRTTFARCTPFSLASKRAVLPRDRGNNETHVSKLLFPPFVAFDFAEVLPVQAFSYLQHFTQSFGF